MVEQRSVRRMASRTDGNGNGTHGYQSIQVQIKNMDRSLQELWTKFDDTNKQVSGFGKPNWQVVIAATAIVFTILGTVLGFAVKPLSDDIEEGKKNDRRWQDEVKSDYIRKELYQREIQGLTAQLTMLRTILIEVRKEAANKEQFVEAAKRIDELARTTATREQLLEVAKRTDETAKIIGNLYPLDRVIQSLQTRIDQLSNQSTPIVSPSNNSRP